MSWFGTVGPRGDPHFHLVHLLGGGLILAGVALLVRAWLPLRSARRRDVIAVRGPYSFVRHPEYLALIIIMLGLLLQWPTLASLLAFTVLAGSCLGLARNEERRMAKEFGCAWECYAYGRPAFVPRLSRIYGALAALRSREATGAGGPGAG